MRGAPQFSARVAHADDLSLDWGVQPELGAFARALAALPDNGRLENATFGLHALQLPGRAFLMVEPDPARPQAWLTSLRAAYGRVAREEAEDEPGVQGVAFGWAAAIAEAWMGVTDADRLVFVNHALISTSLWGGWDGSGLRDALAVLKARFPDKALVFRSLNAWSDEGLMERVREAGARLLPTRVVWTVDDVAGEWLKKRDARRDLRLIEHGGYRIERPTHLTDPEWAKVRALYRGLYMERHSTYNPDYSDAFLRAGMASGFLHFQTLVQASDEIVAFVACAQARDSAGGILTSPLLGYDLGQPQDRGLYRMAMLLPGLEARAAGLRVNHSAGAGAFKRFRGARPQLEYLALFDDHLPTWRRLGYAGLSRALDAVTPALMRIATA